MGRIGEWAPLAARMPRLSNALTQAPVLSSIVKAVAGIAPERALPRLSTQSIRKEIQAMKPADGDPALLFPDTFTSFFRPQTGIAAARVLEAAGARVELPKEHLCCGRPYYDYGMLDEAKASLQKLLSALAPQIEAGTPIVVLEPGCHSVFKDELLKLFPGDARAAKLSKLAVSLAEHLQARSWKPPPVGGKALLHGHCHQKALGGTKPDIALLEAAGIEVSAPDVGCCGMAGSFGFRPETYETSVKVAGLSLLPKVRTAAPAMWIIANGFSCREQIEGLGGRKAMHLADVLVKALV
jgi:Fe-S oxidoreductase